MVIVGGGKGRVRINPRIGLPPLLSSFPRPSLWKPVAKKYTSYSLRVGSLFVGLAFECNHNYNTTIGRGEITYVLLTYAAAVEFIGRYMVSTRNKKKNNNIKKEKKKPTCRMRNRTKEENTNGTDDNNAACRTRHLVPYMFRVLCATSSDSWAALEIQFAVVERQTYLWRVGCGLRVIRAPVETRMIIIVIVTVYIIVVRPKRYCRVKKIE